MCVVSNVMDSFIDRWTNPPYISPITVPQPIWPQPPIPEPKRPTQEELDLFNEMLRMAREYDKRTNQPDCESEDKKRILREIADKFGIKIEFPGEKDNTIEKDL